MSSSPDKNCLSASAALKRWCGAVLFALPVVVAILAAEYTWFAVADRYIVFLYYHDMGPFVPDTSPFSAVTASRYWMSGLVVCGAVMLFYTVVNGLCGLVLADYLPPDWRRVWVLCAVPVVIAIPAITMTVNAPVLPLWNAAQVTLATLAGLAVALLPGEWAAAQPVNLVWLACDGWGLTWVVYGITAAQFLPRWLRTGGTQWIIGWALALVVGVVWLLVMSGLRFWRRKQVPGSGEVLLAGAGIAYLLMPLFHHVSFTDGYYYISNSDNFFAQKVWFQGVVWLACVVFVVALTGFRRRLGTRWVHS
jgi:hypothetical protein